MDKPLALEYEGKQKWYAYEIFKALKYSQTEDAVNKEFEQSQSKDCENHTKNLEEEEKEKKLSNQVQKNRFLHQVIAKMNLILIINLKIMSP